MSLLKSITKEEFENLVKKSFSKAGVIKSRGLVPLGANYRGFDLLVKQWNIDTSHFLGQGHLKNKTHNYSPPMKLEDVFSNKKGMGSSKLRKRLIKEKIFEHKCNRCKNTEWQETKIPLELEHKNGNPFDNSLENLELLCPNCHALTATYRGRNVKEKL